MKTLCNNRLEKFRQRVDEGEDSDIDDALEADKKVIQKEVKKDIQEISLAGFKRGVINPNLQQGYIDAMEVDYIRVYQ